MSCSAETKTVTGTDNKLDAHCMGTVLKEPKIEYAIRNFYSSAVNLVLRVVLSDVLDQLVRAEKASFWSQRKPVIF